MTKIRVGVDLVPILPGQGGTGGGIWTYARSLLQALDEQIPENMEVLCFANSKSICSFQNIKVIGFPYPQGSVMRLLWNHILLPWYCIRHRIDVLHKLATEVPIVKVCRIVCTIHDFMNEFYFDHKELYKKLSIGNKLTCHYFRSLGRFAATKSNRILFVTHSIAQEAKRRYHVPSDKQVVAHLAAPRTSSQDRCSYITESDPKRILYVAAFHSHKGHREAVLIFSEILRLAKIRNMKIKLCFRGYIKDKKYYAEILDLIAEKLLDSYVEFMPFEKGQSVDSIYFRASVTMLLSQYEGFGLPLIESQAAGVPVVCSSIAVFREILGDSAIYVNSGRPHDAALKIVELMSDSKLREEYVKRCYFNVTRFTWMSTARNTVQAYLGAVADE